MLLKPINFVVLHKFLFFKFLLRKLTKVNNTYKYYTIQRDCIICFRQCHDAASMTKLSPAVSRTYGIENSSSQPVACMYTGVVIKIANKRKYIVK